MRQTLIDISPDFKNIRFYFDKTFGLTNGFNSGWEELTNCKILKRSMLIYNAGICYDFFPLSYHFYIYLTTGESETSNVSHLLPVFHQLVPLFGGERVEQNVRRPERKR